MTCRYQPLREPRPPVFHSKDSPSIFLIRSALVVSDRRSISRPPPEVCILAFVSSGFFDPRTLPDWLHVFVYRIWCVRELRIWGYGWINSSFLLRQAQDFPITRLRNDIAVQVIRAGLLIRLCEGISPKNELDVFVLDCPSEKLGDLLSCQRASSV